MKTTATVKTTDTTVTRRKRPIPAQIFTMLLSCGCQADSLQRPAYTDENGNKVFIAPERMKCRTHGW
jgi:hypothetical protein